MLTSQSGQDARSVGPRTKDLAGKGYIMKIPVIAMKMRTSKLILKRFYKGALEKRKTQKKKRLATIKEHARTGKKLPKEMTEEPLDIEEVITGIFKLLKSAKNRVMVIEDIKFRLNCTSTKSRRKACRRIMTKLETMGCIQKIRAVGSEHTHAKKFEMGPVDEAELPDPKNTRFAKCVKYIRDLKPMEWGEAVKGVRSTAVQDDSDGPEEADSDDEQDDGYRIIRAAPLVRTKDGRRIIIPLWRRTHLMHTIYDQVFAAGTDGVRSGMLSGAVFGPFYYRPFDQIMGRWTTNSQQSQPDHLKHVSIVRETDLYKRTANYRYWTTENFQTMLKEKQLDYEAADAAVDAYKISKRSKKGAKPEIAPTSNPGTLDENGFVTIKTTAFVHGDGRGSLQDCQNAAPKKGSGLKPPGTSPLKGRKKVKREQAEGNIEESPRKAKRGKKNTPTDAVGENTSTFESAPQDEGIVVIGRKRKYPPGTEPYLKEKPRVEAVKKALRLGSIKECLADGTSLASETLPADFRPLSSIDEDLWTIEMVSERTFMDLIENKPYQVPLATARYRNTHGKRGRPKNDADEPRPEIAHLGPIFQPGPSGPVEIAPTPNEAEGNQGTTKRSKKRRKVDHQPVGESSTNVDVVSMAIQPTSAGATGNTILQPAATRKTQRATAGKKKKDLVAGDDTEASNKGASKRKARGKESIPKEPTPKKSKVSNGVEAPADEPSPIAAGSMNLDEPSNIIDLSQSDIPSSFDNSGRSEQLAVHLIEIETSSRSCGQIPAASTETGDRVSLTKKAASGNSLTAVPVEVGDNVSAPEPMEIDGVSHVFNSTYPTNDGDVVNAPFTNLQSHQNDADGDPSTEAGTPNPGLMGTSNPVAIARDSRSTPDIIESPEPVPNILATSSVTPEVPKLEPFTDEDGIRMELVRAEVRKNRSIGGVLKANRRRLLLELLSLCGGSVSINAGYHKFVQYLKQQREQLTTVDRRTYNSIIDDANNDNKIYVMGVFKGSRRIGTILALTHLDFQSPSVQEAKLVIFHELDKPFLGRQNMARAIASKPIVPIERIDFERYSHARKPIPLSSKSTRRPLDAEKISTLARLQAITENEKREERAVAISKGRSKRNKPVVGIDDLPVTARTRSKQAAAMAVSSSLLSDASSDTSGPPSDGEIQREPRRTRKPRVPKVHKTPTQRHRRSVSDESIRIDVPEESLHRWQVPRADPSLYPPATTNFPPYTVPETGNFGYGQYDTYESYAAASALVNKTDARYGMLMPNNYEKPHPPRKRQQAGGRATRPRKVMMTNERETNPSLGPLGTRDQQLDVPKEPKKRGRKTKEADEPKVPRAQKPPKEKKPKAKATRALRPKDVPRIRTTPEEDETLTLAIIIIRTLFGGYVRSIKWDLVAKAFPQYDRWSIQTHWPRVRQKMKEEIPQYQSEFEEQYLRAFFRGKLPLFDKNRGVEFDLEWHVNWLRPLIKDIRPVTERRILPGYRKTFEETWDVSISPLDWRKDFFGYMTTMSWKEHQLRNHSNAVLKVEDKGEIAADKRRAVERAKCAWRSIMVTEENRYNDDRAKELMKLYPQYAANAALTELHKVDRFIIRRKKGGRFGTAAAQARILQPWKTSYSTDIFSEAKEFHRNLMENLKNGNECKLVFTKLNTGLMAWIIDRLDRGQIEIYTKDYKTASRGLAESLVTRAINPVLFHFDIFISSEIGIISPPSLDPPDLHDNVPQGSMQDISYPPFLWQNMHDEVIHDMWHRIVRCILAVVVGKPGSDLEVIKRTLQNILSARDLTNAIRWLSHRGGLVEREEGRYWCGEEWLWSGESVRG
ncbi:hypothetical protein ABW19_dt0204571 [Dactylella cylindrospora]|nr:hypothetical protein ABW19_dt0204571 [Dactylella cylindrospora]